MTTRAVDILWTPTWNPDHPRVGLEIGQRVELPVAWINAPTLSIERKRQAYTCVAEGKYRLESLDDSGFQAELSVDTAGLVIDYPGFFERVRRTA